MNKFKQRSQQEYIYLPSLNSKSSVNCTEVRRVQMVKCLSTWTNMKGHGGRTTWNFAWVVIFFMFIMIGLTLAANIVSSCSRSMSSGAEGLSLNHHPLWYDLHQELWLTHGVEVWSYSLLKTLPESSREVLSLPTNLKMMLRDFSLFQYCSCLFALHPCLFSGRL